MQKSFTSSRALSLRALFGTAMICCVGFVACKSGGEKRPAKPIEYDSTLKLPAGFTAEIVARDLGHARHIAVAPNGVIFVKLERPKGGKGILRLQDTDGDGQIDTVAGFGNYTGTGMYLKGDYLYASSNTDVYRYKLDSGYNVIDSGKPELIIKGLKDSGEHNSKSIVLDNNGNLYVNIGAYSNACQFLDRKKGSPGRMPCPILDSAGGIWEFKADVPDQTYGDDHHYATGLRNVVGLDWNTVTNTLFVMQHGRDQLSDLYPQYWNEKQSAELPAECMYELHKGSNCGYPYIFYDQLQHKQVVCPEYGGDGKKTPAKPYQDPVVAFPGHLAPNGLLFYTGDQFPGKYKNGAFIAFHGSWNRAPEPQEGYYVVFVPFENGKPSGNWEIFANNFAGGPDKMQPGAAVHRPCGLAQGPDGSLYVTDDAHGFIWKISYHK